MSLLIAACGGGVVGGGGSTNYFPCSMPTTVTGTTQSNTCEHDIFTIDRQETDSSVTLGGQNEPYACTRLPGKRETIEAQYKGKMYSTTWNGASCRPTTAGSTATQITFLSLDDYVATTKVAGDTFKYYDFYDSSTVVPLGFGLFDPTTHAQAGAHTFDVRFTVIGDKITAGVVQ